MHTSSKTTAGRPLRTAIKTLLAATALSASLHSASAQILYSTGFENPPFANGSTLLDQDGWSTAIPPFLTPNAAMITNTLAQSGLQSVRVRGVDLVDAIDVSPYAAVGSYRRPLNYDASAGLPIVRIQASVRLDGPTLGTGDFFAANIVARSANLAPELSPPNGGAVGELSLSADGFVYGYSGTGADIPLFTTPTPITLNAWHTLGILVDFAANTYTFSVDGLSSAAFPFEPAFVSDVLLRESLVVYARPDAGGFARNNYTAYFDNVSATAVVPEPATASLLTFGCASLLSFRRRTRR